MKDEALWFLTLVASLVLGSALIGLLAGVGWRVASWVAG